ncbi:MAG: glucokinase, partial [Massilia sp.]
VVVLSLPTEDGELRMRGHRWHFSQPDLRAVLGLRTLLVADEFTALAMAAPALGPDECQRFGGGEALPGAVIGLLNVGENLEIAGLIPATHGWYVMPSNSALVAFAPSDLREQAVLRYCRRRYSHVSADLLVSNPGLTLIHQALSSHAGRDDTPLAAATIVGRALAASDPLCVDTLDCFCAMLGTVAAKLAVTLCTRGGIYIGGPVVARLGEFIARSPFRARFDASGRPSSVAPHIPTLLISARFPALSGAAALLSQHLARQGDDAAQPHSTSDLTTELFHVHH